jgi:polyphenol oxidase
MPFTQVGELRYYQFDLLRLPGLVHAVFTRHGGVSPIPWISLNLGGLSGDKKENVVENRRRIFEAVGMPVESIYDAWQVHGTDIICSGKPRPLDLAHVKADGIITDNPKVTLFMRFADCVPILLFDPVRRVVGLAHAGWQGTIHQIARITVERMASEYGSNPGDILAAIGPSIGPDHYEIGPDVASQVKAAFSDDPAQFLAERDGKTFFDLWRTNQVILEKTGIKQVQIAGLCTACHTEDWYSHRAEQGKTGRFGALIALKEKNSRL